MLHIPLLRAFGEHPSVPPILLLMELELYLTELQPSNFVILENVLHCKVLSLCNQLLLQFSMDHFEILHTCSENIENVHMGF